MLVSLLVGFFVDLVRGAFAVILAAVPPMPTWAFSALGGLSSVVNVINGFDTWLPVDLVFTVAGTVAAVWGVSVTVSLVRTVISYFTFGGGAT
ncbi:MAG: hypothetical protein ACOYBY_17760 [Dermatophilaceae bacterium]